MNEQTKLTIEAAKLIVKISDQRLLVEWLKDVHCEELVERAQETIDLGWYNELKDIGVSVFNDFTDSKLLLQEQPLPELDMDKIDWEKIGGFLVEYYKLKPYQEPEDEALTHKLKIDREYFQAIKSGRMKFYIVENGDYEVGDTLLLIENVTCDEVEVQVTYKLQEVEIIRSNEKYEASKGHIVLGIEFSDYSTFGIEFSDCK